MMMSRRSRTSQLHKRITQTKSHKNADVTSKNGMTKQRLGHSRATQVRMEYLRLVNLTEICPSRRVGHFKAPCYRSGWRKLESTIKQKLMTMKTY